MTNQAAKADALQRALRTLWQGFGVDALIAIGAGLAVLLTGGLDVLSGAFWTALGVLVVKSFLTALASYLQRLNKEPKPLEKLVAVEEIPQQEQLDYSSPTPIFDFLSGKHE